MTPGARAILIGGTSHAGKSTLAQALAERLGWTAASTDYLARHPGRPWRAAPDVVPPHVAAYYLDLTDDERMASVQAHYASLSPRIDEMVRAADGLVLEGSALWPPTIVALALPYTAAICLTADPDLITRRIRAESGYEASDATGRAMIEAFAERARQFDRLMMDEVRRLGLPHLAVEDGVGPDELAARVLALI